MDGVYLNFLFYKKRFIMDEVRSILVLRFANFGASVRSFCFTHPMDSNKQHLRQEVGMHWMCIQNDILDAPKLSNLNTEILLTPSIFNIFE